MNTRNLQQIPSGSTYGKIVKQCFISPPGWVFAGADFSSLEDRINALITVDPNKLKVYTDGYDGHNLRAFYYFGNEMPDIVEALPSERVFKIVTKTQIIYGKSGDFIVGLGNTKTLMEDYYEANKRV